MKCIAFSAKTRRLRSMLFGAIVLASLSQSRADTLVNGNSVVTFDFTGGGGMTGWNIDGQNQVDQQWFYYRIGGSGGESPINMIAAPVVTLGTNGSSRTLLVGYTNSSVFSVSVKYTLATNAPGSNKGNLGELVSVFNYTGTNLDLHFFDYSHFDLNQSGNQTIWLGTNASGIPNSIGQTNGSGVSLSETIGSIGPANFGEVALGGVLGASLTDGNPTSLNPTILGPLGPADVESAFEWDWGGAAGTWGSHSLSITGPGIVPEPSALALFAIGLGAVGLRRRRQTQAKTASEAFLNREKTKNKQHYA
jgi:hypothetical protein